MAEPDTKKLLEHIEKKWTNKLCPMCGHGNWTVQDKVFEFREFHHGNMVFGGSAIIPVVPVTCTNCGNSVLVNAIVSGVVEAAEKKDG